MAEETVNPSASNVTQSLPVETGQNGNTGAHSPTDLQTQNQSKESPTEEEPLGPEDINFTKEDIVLYAFCGLLMFFLGLFFWTTQTHLEKNLLEDEVKNVSVADQ